MHPIDAFTFAPTRAASLGQVSYSTLIVDLVDGSTCSGSNRGGAPGRWSERPQRSERSCGTPETLAARLAADDQRWRSRVIAIIFSQRGGQTTVVREQAGGGCSRDMWPHIWFAGAPRPTGMHGCGKLPESGMCVICWSAQWALPQAHWAPSIRPTMRGRCCGRALRNRGG
jgi:hypothetical protein